MTEDYRKNIVNRDSEIFGSFLNFFLRPSTIIVFLLCEIVIDGAPVAILGAFDPDTIPITACCTLVNVSFTVIVCVGYVMSTEERPCRQRPAQDLM